MLLFFVWILRVVKCLLASIITFFFKFQLSINVGLLLIVYVLHNRPRQILHRLPYSVVMFLSK